MNKSRIALCTLLAHALLVPAAVVFAQTAATPAVDPVKMPYEADVTDAEGRPINGKHSVQVRLFDDAGEQVYEESFEGHLIEDGRLSLLVGSGTPVAASGPGAVSGLSSDVFARPTDGAIEIVIDGEVLGGRQSFKTVPRAVHARRVPASGIQYGGEHGLIRAEALGNFMTVSEGFYSHGETVPAPAPGWTCKHAVHVASPGPAFDWLSTGGTEMWVGHVGSGTVNVPFGVSGSTKVTFTAKDPNVVDIRRVKNPSSTGTKPTFTTIGGSSSILPLAHVRSFCTKGAAAGIVIN